MYPVQKTAPSRRRFFVLPHATPKAVPTQLHAGEGMASRSLLSGEILVRFAAMLDTPSSRRKPGPSDLKDPQKSLDPDFRRVTNR